MVAGVKPREAVVRLRRPSAPSGQLVFPVSDGYPVVAGPHPFAGRLVAAEVEPQDGPPVPCGETSAVIQHPSNPPRFTP